ncbi:macro domain-containing protein [Deinococcus yavapaiensis]|uniref:O-acetyl-ADP-ribose deacetylase (Regulator of RNase III) n=1 Tax=Deinococcus yavapaiensis KR-236 TaxID=694435 RepID=A0A318SRH2_9DEIO|nr:macro domain-containing protein [Deinococcus yavapaiensis]PYE55677.1 O-acetyl-ADP-ribose deacetylase (regulator of RNase III) [Deinococcus yavapaiensis KR-236]
MPITLLQGNIVEQRTDALVTAANKGLLGGGGVDGVIHRAAGPELLRFIRTLGGCPTGSAVISPAFDLERQGVKYVIHAVGPIWRGGRAGEDELLAGAYRHSVELAVRHACQSVAFPSISTGVYGYPAREAARVALRALEQATANLDLDVRVVLFDAETLHEFEGARRELAEEGASSNSS